MDGDNVLLKFGTRGISKNKWNFPGGKMESQETIFESAKREVEEETGLVVENMFYHGKLDAKDVDDPVLRRVHILSCESFSGKLQSSEEGEVRWFHKSQLPLEQMWKDRTLWLDMVFTKDKFDVYVLQDGKANDEILSFNLKIEGKRLRAI